MQRIPADSFTHHEASNTYVMEESDLGKHGVYDRVIGMTHDDGCIIEFKYVDLERDGEDEVIAMRFIAENGAKMSILND